MISFLLSLLSKGITPGALKLIVRTTTPDESFTIRCQDVGTFNATVSWGDGNTSTITVYDDADLTHVFASAGDHEVAIVGEFPNIYFNEAGDTDKVVALAGGSEHEFVALDSAFRGCPLTQLPDAIYGPTITDLSNTFANTVDIPLLPAGFLDNTPLVTNFSSTFYENLIPSIPSGLFDYTTVVTNFEGTFADNTLESIPAGLFDNTPLVTIFQSTFYLNAIASIPAGLFDYTPLVTDFSYVFSDNFIAAIPSGLFDNTPNVTTFEDTFSFNSIVSIPSGLFDYATGVEYFSYTFYYNETLTTVPAGLFDNWVGPPAADCFLEIFGGCTSLTEQSVENVLVSVAASGVSAPGSGTDITLDGAASLGTIQANGTLMAAVTTLKTAGWTPTYKGTAL